MDAKKLAIKVRELREQTGAGLMDCKKALIEAEGDRDKAVELLKERYTGAMIMDYYRRKK